MLITGVYGSGKSSVAEEMAAVLEEHNASYALLDLDFLAWFDTGDEEGPTEHQMMLTNLAAVVGNYWRPAYGSSSWPKRFATQRSWTTSEPDCPCRLRSYV